MRALLASVANPMFAIFVLIFLAVVFWGIVYWVYFKTPQKVHDERAKMPLIDDEGGAGRG